jgi:nitrilase
MTGDTYPIVRVAAVHAAPVFLDRAGTIAKIERLTAEAAARGAEVVAFGESYLPGFPIWNAVLAPIDQHAFYRRLFANAVTVPGPEVTALAGIARRHHVTLSVGITEKAPQTMGTMWNSNLMFDPAGTLVNHRRKLVPTWAERLTWASGDAGQLAPVEINEARIGVLICGENTNSLARYALLAQGEQVHIATYPPVWPFRRDAAADYNLTDAIRMRSAAHSFEGKVFSVVASTILDEDAITDVSGGDDRVEAILRGTAPAASMVTGPTGELISDVMVGSEGIVFATVDLGQSVDLKQIHDITGSVYNRFDIFNLTVNQARQAPITITNAAEEHRLVLDRDSFGDDEFSTNGQSPALANDV